MTRLHRQVFEREIGSASRLSVRPSTSLVLVLRRRTIVRVLLLTVVALTLLSLAGQIAKYVLGYPTLLGAVAFFYVELENNLPTWYQTMALMFAAVLLATIGFGARRTRAPFAGHWLALAIIFVLLSMDETASLHERTIAPLQRVTGALPGVWQPVWVILGFGIAAAVGAAFLRFLLHLPQNERRRILTAGVLYVGGALGMEMSAAAVFTTSDPTYKESFVYALMAHGEELLEMLGVVVLIDVLLCRLMRTTVASSLAVTE